MPELRKVCAAVVISDCSIIDGILSKHSDLDKSCRILTYCSRFSGTSSRPPTTFISHEKTSMALHLACKIVQQHSFPEKYKALKNNGVVNWSSRILALSPFMDDSGLMRVGGRWQNSDLLFDARHPILLPCNHKLIRRIIMQEHLRNLHAGHRPRWPQSGSNFGHCPCVPLSGK